MEQFEALVTLMTEQEERLCKKIDDVHTDVKTQNSRVSTLETDQAVLAEQQKHFEELQKIQQNTCSKRFTGLEVHHRVTQTFNWFADHKKVTMLLLVVFAVVFIQSVVNVIKSGIIDTVLSLF